MTQLPTFFVKYLQSLNPTQLSALYIFLCDDPNTATRDAMMDVIAPLATATPE